MKLGRVSVTNLTLRNGVLFMSGTTPPVDGDTGAGEAGPGSLYSQAIDGDGAVYLNVGTKAAPVWKQLMATD